MPAQTIIARPKKTLKISYLFNISQHQVYRTRSRTSMNWNDDASTLNYCVDGSIWHFKFPKVVQAHTLSEVGNLGTALFRVYSGTILPIFIEIGLYLTDKEQNICWHSFL